MKLYLLRHGIAVDRIGGEITSDWQRPLTKEGKLETEQVAQGLQRIGIKADLIVSSPLIRAKETAEIVRKILSKTSQLQICDALAPGGTASDIYKFINTFAQLNDIFLVGHEPDLSRLAGNLLWTGPELYMPFKKSGICRIDVSDLPPTSPGILKWFLPPKLASALNP